MGARRRCLPEQHIRGAVEGDGVQPAKDDIFCLFDGVLDNLGSLSQQDGLCEGANEVLLMIEAYKMLRDRAPYPASFMLSQFSGSYAFVLFDKSTSSLLVACDPEGKVSLF
ncbi:hypothetical protein GUJ93_ZPchr0013g37578 [Zizania palustris]|uniref:DUF3700 domain-containing protein n=1 Tax=Zizania palustris TaxID=103762 RepID=A0A8J6C078_ZIZPA|nr:hypothetical protein GUJ93_ZPchr0013g37578 [Zizania palustris]